MTFPEGFWWGTAASSTQAEGAAPASDWWGWERAGKAPLSGDGNGFARRYAEDFALFAGKGLTHHRLSIEWARIEPSPGKRDPEAVDHYNSVLEAARAAGLHVWVCLHHFTLPAWFTAGGGFVDDTMRDRHWRPHVEFCAEAFGENVFGWKPINEPAGYAVTGFLTGAHPPGLADLGSYRRALRGIHLAYLDAWRVLRGTKPVATIHNLTPLFPAGGGERRAAAADNATWRTWVRGLKEGVLEIPGLPAEEIPDLAGSCDLVGFSYYSAATVPADGAWLPYPPGARTGPLGYAPWSPGIRIVLDRLREELAGFPILICEHGVGTDDDEWRCEVLRESLGLVGDALRDGTDVRGFFHWTGVDNYEWLSGHDVSFGLFDRQRRPRPSADLLASYAV